MAACSSACGWCGRCTDAWEQRPEQEEIRRCDICGAPLHWTDRHGLGPIRIVCLGEFCSDRCANEGSERHARALRTRQPSHDMKETVR